MNEVTILFKNFMMNKWKITEEELNTMDKAFYQNQLDAFNYGYSIAFETINRSTHSANELND